MSRSTAVLAALALALGGLPWLGLPPFYESFLYLVLHWVVLATSWNILSGYSGYFSFGHGAFFGIGVYTTAVLCGKFDWPFLWTLPAAAAVSALFGAGLGLVVFRLPRLRGELFALLTLAVTFVIATLILNTPVDGGPGVYLSAVPVPNFGPSPASAFYLMALVLAVVTLGIARYVASARLGTGLFAIHDDEDVAEVSGVPTLGYKLAAFSLSCGLAAMAGSINALYISYVTVGQVFSILVPLNVVLMSVLGGTAHWFGPAVGAAAVTALLYAFTAGDYAVLGRGVVGLVLVLVILFMPAGILGRFARRRRAPPARPAHRSVQRHPLAERGRVLLEVKGVSKAFSGVRALDGVSLQVRQGEILGLVGPNGSGKSTLINVVSGHYRADAGSLTFAGHDLRNLAAHRISRAGVSRTYQIPRPFARMTVIENVALAAMFGHASLDRARAHAEARRWLDFTGLAAKADAFPDELNLHQRKFLELARALASQPSLLFLDEVLSGLTPSEIGEAIRLVRSIRDQGATIVFVEHVMRAVMELTERIVVLDQGRVIAEGAPAEVMQRPEVVTAYLGKAHA